MKTLKKWLARNGVFLGVVVIRVFARVLPWRVGIILGRLMGGLAFYALPKDRNRALRHLKIAFGEKLGDKEIWKVAQLCFAHLGMSFFEVLLLPRLSRKEIETLVSMEGEERLAEACRKRSGVIIVTGHIGNWELFGAAVSKYPLKVLAAPLYDERLDAMMAECRAKVGIETIQRGSPKASRQILSMLRDGSILGILIDQDTDVAGTFVNFFGKPAYTPTAAASLALHGKVEVFMGCCHRQKDGKHRVIIDGPVTIEKTKNRQDDIEKYTALFTQYLENYILKAPEQWVWMHRRWAKTPKP